MKKQAEHCKVDRKQPSKECKLQNEALEKQWKLDIHQEQRQIVPYAPCEPQLLWCSRHQLKVIMLTSRQFAFVVCPERTDIFRAQPSFQGALLMLMMYTTILAQLCTWFYRLPLIYTLRSYMLTHLVPYMLLFDMLYMLAR